MNYIKRQMEEIVLKLSGCYPVVMVCGQRQTGKSTMLRHLSGEKRAYVNLDDAKARMLAKNDPELFFENYGTPILIDEFQRVPELLLEIKKIVDEAKYKGENYQGMFWLSGSQKFEMMKSISETLAGRVAILNMMPMSSHEIEGDSLAPFTPSIDDLKNNIVKPQTTLEVFQKIFRGGLPELIANPEMDRETYYASYMNTYIERDVSSLEQVGKLDEFRIFMTYMAANTAQELKYDSISKVVGVSAPTIKEWVTILQRAGIIYIVKPYYSSISKRLVKTPKCYFLDTGLAAYLTSWPDARTLMNGNASGAFFETYAVGEILKSYYNIGKEPPVFYYRDIDQKEIDLLIVEGDKVYPIEIKQAKMPTSPDKNFTVLDKLGLKIMPGLILCMTNELFPISKNVYLCPISLI